MRGPNPTKTKRSRSLRQNSTDTEQKLWQRLRARQIAGLKFVRQEPIGPFIVDFICRERRLIVEVDGSQHADNPRDKQRDAYLIAQGYCVLRFWNNDVLANTNGVLERILAVSQQPLTRIATRSDLSPQAGRGTESRKGL
jgi:very-short-patch-repair endonuclease